MTCIETFWAIVSAFVRYHNSLIASNISIRTLSLWPCVSVYFLRSLYSGSFQFRCMSRSITVGAHSTSNKRHDNFLITLLFEHVNHFQLETKSFLIPIFTRSLLNVFRISFILCLHPLRWISDKPFRSFIRLKLLSIWPVFAMCRTIAHPHASETLFAIASCTFCLHFKCRTENCTRNLCVCLCSRSVFG